MKKRFAGVSIILLLVGCNLAGDKTVSAVGESRIDICGHNRWYWQYGGEPVLLIGGSVEDNLFQVPGVAQHLEVLKNCGGNYVRCTMSSRDKGNVWSFGKTTNGKYDLDTWNKEYWQRFADFLQAADERDIIVQIEIWATFDYYRDNWDVNPFNPKNNVNYTTEESNLPLEVTTHPTRTENNFFWSVPVENNVEPVLKYQRAFVDKVLSYSLRHGNVLYCMDNETSVTPEWGWYWSRYIQEKAKQANVKVYTTEMWDHWDLASAQHNATFERSDIYSFVDVSQNNHQTGQQHWDNAQRQRKRIWGNRRPLNNVKIYGADTGKYGTDRDGCERFWRNVFGGMASARFHRPDSGLGLSEKAQAHIRSMRMLTETVDVFACEPANELLSERTENEAYCMARPGIEYVLFFPDGGQVKLSVRDADKVEVRWLDIMKSQWGQARTVQAANGTIILTSEGGYHAAVVKVLQSASLH